MCRVEQVFKDEATPFQLRWSKCEKVDGETQLDYPCSIAINNVNENIYVTDFNKHRIQIFSKEGEWIRSLKNEKTINPQNIFIQTDLIYLQCDKMVLIFTASDEKMIQSSKSFHSSLRGICADNSHVYVGFWTEMKLIFFSPNLNEEKQITLNPQSFKLDSKSESENRRSPTYSCPSSSRITRRSVRVCCLTKSNKEFQIWYQARNCT